jgi:DNA replication and repair protein RecF
VRINHQPAPSVGALGEIVKALWLTPAMDGLFTGPAADRRRFLDRLVLNLDPGHASRVADFEKAMRQRNRLLENLRQNERWLSSLEHSMSMLGIAVSSARIDALRRLKAALAERHGGVFPDPDIAIEGDFEAKMAENRPSIEIEEAYRAELQANRPKDAAAGRTLSGPHRSDLSVRHRARDVPAALASTGEQKGLLIAQILAHARLVKAASGGLAPLLLLDEIAAHLDDMRRAALFAEILALGAQAWMTGTDRALFTDIAADAQCFEVADGTVAAV